MNALLLVAGAAAATTALRLVPLLRHPPAKPAPPTALVAASLSALLASTMLAPAPGLTMATRVTALLAAGVVAKQRRSLTQAVAAAVTVGWATSLFF